MSLQRSIEPRVDYLYARFEGAWDNAELVQAIQEVFEEAARLAYRRIVFDARQVDGTINDRDRASVAYAGVEKYTGLLMSGQMNHCQVVFLMKREMLSPIKIGESIGNLKGLMLRVTDSVPEAFIWLGLKPEPDLEA